MNCREVEQWVCAERDGTLEPVQRAAFDAHLAGCADCRRLRATLAEAMDQWRKDGASIEVPDVGVEWQAVRRRIRAGGETGTVPARHWWTKAPWLAVPLGAAAALALYFTAGLPHSVERGNASQAHQLARAEFVELADDRASAVVFVDQDSGWLVVWEVEGEPEAGI